jgi:hypothetical protein
MKSWHESNLTPEAFFARQRRIKRLWLAVAIVAIAVAVAALF